MEPEERLSIDYDILSKKALSRFHGRFPGSTRSDWNEPRKQTDSCRRQLKVAANPARARTRLGLLRSRLTSYMAVSENQKAYS